MLRTIVGPLHGLNLRNVCFHGFVAPHEWHPFYTSFFIVLILSISERLSLFPGHRPLRNLKEEFHDLPYFQPLGIFNECEVLDLKLIHHQIDNNYFVIPRTESIWKYAIDYFQSGILTSTFTYLIRKLS